MIEIFTWMIIACVLFVISFIIGVCISNYKSRKELKSSQEITDRVIKDIKKNGW